MLVFRGLLFHSKLVSTPVSQQKFPAGFKIFFWAVIVFDLAFIAFSIWHGIKAESNPAYYFDEGRLGTRISILHLLAIGCAAFLTMWHRKAQSPWTGWRTPWLIWALIGAGFIFLAADDAFKIHEGIDDAIHKIFKLKVTAWSDRIDDGIIGLYGIVGMIALYLYRQELLRFKTILPFLILGFCAAFLQVALDMAGNRTDLVQMLFAKGEADQGEPAKRKGGKRKAERARAEESGPIKDAHHWVEASEGAVQLLAEGFFLIAFGAAAATASRWKIEPESAKITSGSRA